MVIIKERNTLWRLSKSTCQLSVSCSVENKMKLGEATQETNVSQLKKEVQG